jgi:hypothetical protein
METSCRRLEGNQNRVVLTVPVGVIDRSANVRKSRRVTLAGETPLLSSSHAVVVCVMEL